MQAYQKALELDPNCASAHFNLAVAALQKGKLDEAASHYQAALAQKPNAETYNGYGFVLAQQGRAEEATKQFRKAIEINPKYTPAYNNLGDALAKQGKLDEAEFYYQASLREKPSAAIHTALGLVLKKLGRNGEAAEEFRKAIALDPANVKARRNLANLAGGA
jgi:Tfp pilus assembly protein PilF